MCDGRLEGGRGKGEDVLPASPAEPPANWLSAPGVEIFIHGQVLFSLDDHFFIFNHEIRAVVL